MSFFKDIPIASLKNTPYSPTEEVFNTSSHVIGLIFSIVALLLLVNKSNGDLTRIISFGIFAGTGILLFLSSILYHSSTNSRLKKQFKLLDHCAIYLFIAGTYTPLLNISIAGTLGHSLLGFIWIFALAGIVFKIKLGNKYKKISLCTYLGMGFISFGILGELLKTLPDQAIGLLILGGAIYCLGVFFYVKKTVPYTHAIWHLFVLGGASCHFLMIYWYV
jgi:hemolysin III